MNNPAENPKQITPQPDRPIKIVHASKTKLLNRVLVDKLEKGGEMVIVGYCSSGGELLDMLETQTPDLLILDFFLDEPNGLDILQLIKDIYPELRVVVLTFYLASDLVLKAIRFGAKAYVTTSESIEILKTAIHHSMGPGIYLSPEAAKLAGDTLHDISKTERQVLLLLAENKPESYIATRLKISEKTVKAICAHLLVVSRAKTVKDMLDMARAEKLI
jgi:two-component system NarL family response regulator